MYDFPRSFPEFAEALAARRGEILAQVARPLVEDDEATPEVVERMVLVEMAAYFIEAIAVVEVDPDCGSDSFSLCAGTAEARIRAADSVRRVMGLAGYAVCEPHEAN